MDGCHLLGRGPHRCHSVLLLLGPPLKASGLLSLASRAAALLHLWLGIWFQLEWGYLPLRSLLSVPGIHWALRPRPLTLQGRSRPAILLTSGLLAILCNRM